MTPFFAASGGHDAGVTGKEAKMSEDVMDSVALDVPAAHVVRSSGGRHWHGIDAAEILHPLDDFTVPAIPRHVLVFNLAYPMEATERRSGRAGRLGLEGVMLLSAGRPRDWHLEHCGEVRHLHLYVDPALVHRAAAEVELHPDRVELVDAFGVHDPQLEHTGIALLSELRSRAPHERIYADALATVLAVHLLRHHSSVAQSPLRGPLSLPSSSLTRVTDYIEDNLAEDLALAALADVAHLSPYHFARLFKASTGFTPHQYLIHRRVERAKLLLATTNQPLTTVAHAVGFASGSHLAMHFKRLTGLTPGRYRE